jgi:simple sugar transport system permease protein
LLLFGVFVAFAGASPAEVYFQMFRGAFGTWFSFQNTMQRAAPLMLTALCTALPLKLGLVVIGGEGAMVLGGLAAASAGLTAGPHHPLVTAGLMAVAGFMVGGLWIGSVGMMRSLRGVNETISSLLMNYIAIALFNHLVEGALRDPSSLNKPSTLPIPDNAMLSPMPGMDVHWGLGYGLIACLLAYVLMHRTTFGFAARMVGGNLKAALLAGLKVRHIAVLTCFLAGGSAGLAGMVEVAAVHGRANASLISGYGYSGILVAFLARSHPLAVVPVALILGGIGASGGLLQRATHLPDAAVNVVQGLLFVTILASDAAYGRLPGWLARLHVRPAAPLGTPAAVSKGATP